MSIKVTIGKDRTGVRQVTVEGVNIVGPICQQITERVRNALGTTVADENKQEFFETELVQEQEQTLEGQ